MLFATRFIPGIHAGQITETWRAWSRPQARTGGVYTVQRAGLIRAESVEQVALSDADESAAAAAGFDGLDEMLAALRQFNPDLGPDDLVWRVRFTYLGTDERPRLGDEVELTEAEVATIDARLAGYDQRSAGGAWTAQTLALIADHPGRRAGDLADELGWERAPFKQNVRKLKALGLTESLEIGYRLSPRGRSYLSVRRPR
ncbi:MAG: hypothetical protein ACR2H3_01395 [Acidimicrobiales bacterium]